MYVTEIAKLYLVVGLVIYAALGDTVVDLLKELIFKEYINARKELGKLGARKEKNPWTLWIRNKSKNCMLDNVFFTSSPSCIIDTIHVIDTWNINWTAEKNYLWLIRKKTYFLNHIQW